MTGLTVALFASQGPFGPTPLTCLLVPLMSFGPVVLVLIALRSLLGAGPLPVWLLAVLVVGTPVLAYFLWPIPIGGRTRGLLNVWLIVGWAAVVLAPAALVREAVKREWFRGGADD